ncbi:MAG TPA: proton-conducting transporter membrane subunit [Devosiaceae bacterium]|jgi:formate hydrogenlyase subunit 3/multisubunit Na+/H+ antiporter MnhD subunit|nr:proton-conducting transporter membrane subunit [Devosiaceae bacterium]
MMGASGPLLPLLTLVVPLALGALASVPVVRRHAILLLPLAPLPGLACALLSPHGIETSVPELLLGVVLGMDAPSALLLGMSSFLWLMAGIFATAYLRDTRKPAVFAGFWCLTLAGNLGVFLARDAATFYVSFTAVSLASYILVVHDASEGALRAGRIYIVLAVIGEAALLLAFLIGAGMAESLQISEIREVLGRSVWGNIALVALVVGFGVKAGMMPLHIWLPLAHPAAPTPASAVLSGAIVKAGIFGLLQFMPGGGAALGYALLAIGLASAYLGVLAGLAQRNTKALLAYSTISQMGLLVAVAGAATAAEDPRPGLMAAAFYAAHHGLTKGGLFLSVGLVAATGRTRLAPVMAVVALLALSVAGLPLTGGALAKLAVKGPMEIGPAEMLLTLSAVGTALLLLRFVLLLWNEHATAAGARAQPLLVLPFMAIAVAAVALPWALFPAFSGHDRLYAFSGSNIWSAVWPLVLAGALGAIALRLRIRAPRIPEGDIVVPLERAAEAAVAGWARQARRLRPMPDVTPGGVIAGIPAIDKLEVWVGRWSIAGLLLLALVLALTLQ